ncbi:MAG TPA: biotin transporter BioY [Candidatus Methanomethylia archaeon]|nr:biotin transporter BioY [Candidatus Methanomethylicia archaeon]
MRKARDIALISCFAALTAIGGYLYLPLPLSPVPVTLQTFFTYLAIDLLKSKRAALSQLVYVAMGAFGLPVFAGGGSGVAVLVGPTGGYLLGFIAAAYLLGLCTEKLKQPSVTWLFAINLAAFMVICTLGIAVLSYWFGFPQSAYVGFIPFIPGDAAKAAMAAFIAYKLHPLLGEHL